MIIIKYKLTIDKHKLFCSVIRNNIGQYWIPSTLRILPGCLTVIEEEIKLSLNKKSSHVLHAYMLILKSARSNNLMSTEALQEVC